MKNKIKTNLLGCLSAIILLFISTGCSNTGNSSANEKLVKDYYTAYEKKDWNMLRSIVTDSFTFTSPNDDHIDLKTYQGRCWPMPIKLKILTLKSWWLTVTMPL